MTARYWPGGLRRDTERMIAATAKIRDVGGLPAEAALVFTQLLLNLSGHAGRERADQLIAAFLDAADVRVPN